MQVRRDMVPGRGQGTALHQQDGRTAEPDIELLGVSQCLTQPLSIRCTQWGPLASLHDTNYRCKT